MIISCGDAPANRGDTGESRFYISMEDDIMRLFGGERIHNMMETLKIDEDMPLDFKVLSTAIENAQKSGKPQLPDKKDSSRIR